VCTLQPKGSDSQENWPDGISTHCSACKKQFGLITRRHHCRGCGCIACSTCLDKTTKRCLLGCSSAATTAADSDGNDWEDIAIEAKEEADRLAKEEGDRKTKEEADRRAKEEADRKAKEEADRKTKEEADRKAKEEADRRAKEEDYLLEIEMEDMKDLLKGRDKKK
jgi:hypothetical protein